MGTAGLREHAEMWRVSLSARRGHFSPLRLKSQLAVWKTSMLYLLRKIGLLRRVLSGWQQTACARFDQNLTGRSIACATSRERGSTFDSVPFSRRDRITEDKPYLGRHLC
jgi:hypothetical protein